MLDEVHVAHFHLSTVKPPGAPQLTSAARIMPNAGASEAPIVSTVIR